MTLVKDIGELGLLKRLQPFCAADLVGDDAAVIDIPAGESTVVTTDVLVDGVHFSDRTTSPTDIGWRATAVNLSDLAAMGAAPLGITVGLSLPGDTEVDWVTQVYQGMADCLAAHGGVILGGDICRAPRITLAITALGTVQPDQVWRRDAAQPDQAIVVTGVHGASRAGLELLLHPDRGSELTPAARQTLIQAHQRPIPRFDAVQCLRQLLVEEGQSGKTAVAAMDSSDGLANAVLQICTASGVGAELVRSQLPIPPALTNWLSAEQAVDWTLYGGEDFELVFCLDSSLAEALVAKLGSGAAIVGHTTTQPQVIVRDQSGKYDDLVLDLQTGFQHF